MTKEGKKKIIYIITKSNWGGAQRYVYDLATNIDKNKFDCLVVAGGGGELIDRLNLANIKTRVLPELGRDVKILDDIKTFFRLITLFIKERPDIIHLNSSKVGGMGGLAGRITRVPKIIFTGHGWAFNEDRNSISKLIIYLLSWTTILLSHKTIAVSTPIKAQISKLPLVRKKVYVIHNGVSPINFISKNEAKEELIKDINEKIIIGTIAELHKNKGLDFLIKAMGLLKQVNNDVALVIIGAGEELEKLKTLATEINVSDKVHLVGFKKDASRYLKAFDIFVLSSRTEAFAYVLLEAGMAELPVVATNVGGIPDIVENMKTGILIKQRNPKELAAAIKHSIANKELASDLAKNLNKKVTEEFNIGKMVEKTSKLYS